VAFTLATAESWYSTLPWSPRPSPFGVRTDGVSLSLCSDSGAGALPIAPVAGRVWGAAPDRPARRGGGGRRDRPRVAPGRRNARVPRPVDACPRAGAARDRR